MNLKVILTYHIVFEVKSIDIIFKILSQFYKVNTLHSTPDPWKLDM